MARQNRNKVICVDFDGVLHDYSKGWQGKDVFGDHIPGAPEAIQKLHNEGCIIILHTARPDTPAIRQWLRDHKIPIDYFNYNPEQFEKDCVKPYADVYIDDRAISFTGDWSQTLKDVAEYKNWQGYDSQTQD